MNDHLTISELAERGWSPAMVRDYLGPADKVQKTEHGDTTTMKLYDVNRVLDAEGEEDFADRQLLRWKRGSIVKLSQRLRREEQERVIELLRRTTRKLYTAYRDHNPDAEEHECWAEAEDARDHLEEAGKWMVN